MIEKDPHAVERNSAGVRTHVSIQRWSCMTLTGNSFAVGRYRDAAVLTRLRLGHYTAIARGSGGTTGIELVEASRYPDCNTRRDPRSALSEVELGMPVQPVNCVATRVALWPPKPNELFNTTRTFFSRATFGV